MWKRFNDRWADAEAGTAMFMLILMRVVAFAQALVRNLTQYGVPYANALLEWLGWGDFIMQKGTLWLAFLGASLAMGDDTHVAIDIVPRYASPRARVLLRGVVGIAGAVICLFLARAFLDAIIVNGAERPSDVELFAPEGSVHVCDASDALLHVLGQTRGPFCSVRALLRALELRMDTPGAAFQLIVPVMLLVMALRSLSNGGLAFVRFARGEVDDEPPHGGLPGAADEVTQGRAARAKGDAP